MSQNLEDQIYQSSLVGKDSKIRRGNPFLTIPLTILGYAGFASLLLVLGAQKVEGGHSRRTNRIDIIFDPADPPPPPPPPALPPPLPAITVRQTSVRPPLPPPDPALNNIVPEIVPTEPPKEDLSRAYQGSTGTNSGNSSGPFIAGSTGSNAPPIAGATIARVVDFDFSNIKIKYQPPAPPYPPMAKMSKIQGTVVVEVIIGTDGTPTSATAIEGPPQLRAAAEAYAMKWQFEPAMLSGQPQVAKFRLTMPFRLK